MLDEHYGLNINDKVCVFIPGQFNDDGRPKQSAGTIIDLDDDDGMYFIRFNFPPFHKWCLINHISLISRKARKRA